METVVDRLDNLRHSIGTSVEDLLFNHSTIYQWNTGEGPIVFITGRDYAFRELDVAGRQLQSRLLEDYRHFHSLVAALLVHQPKEALNDLKEANETMIQTIELESTWCKTTKEALARASAALEVHSSLLSRLYDHGQGTPTFVPDTNALLHNPSLPEWSFPDIREFAIGLVPSVLEELDFLKVSHRDLGVRDKAESVIRQIKEYRRRGPLAQGVPLVVGTSSLFAVATEPNAEAALPWLDLSKMDDRFLASLVEVMRGRPRSPVFAVTRDINLQNKAEFARLPFVEPPDPS